jgi:hypothetical protein
LGFKTCPVASVLHATAVVLRFVTQLVGFKHFTMTMLRLLFCVSVLYLPVSFASKPLPLHSDVVSSLLKEYNPHLVPLNVSHCISYEKNAKKQ